MTLASASGSSESNVWCSPDRTSTHRRTRRWRRSASRRDSPSSPDSRRTRSRQSRSNASTDRATAAETRPGPSSTRSGRRASGSAPTARATASTWPDDTTPAANAVWNAGHGGAHLGARGGHGGVAGSASAAVGKHLRRRRARASGRELGRPTGAASFVGIQPCADPLDIMDERGHLGGRRARIGVGVHQPLDLSHHVVLMKRHHSRTNVPLSTEERSDDDQRLRAPPGGMGRGGDVSYPGPCRRTSSWRGTSPPPTAASGRRRWPRRWTAPASWPRRGARAPPHDDVRRHHDRAALHGGRRARTRCRRVPGRAPFVRGRTAAGTQPTGWDVRQRVDAAAGAGRAVEELERGATSVLLDLAGVEAITADVVGAALEGVLLDLAPVVLAAGARWQAAAEAVGDAPALRVARRRSARRGGGRDRSPTTTPTRARRRGRLDHPARRRPARPPRRHHRRRPLPRCRRVGRPAARRHGRRRRRLPPGARRTGRRPADAIGRIELRLAATADQFATIATFRAVRRLWAGVAEAVGAPDADVADPRRDVDGDDDGLRPVGERAALDRRLLRRRHRRRRRRDRPPPRPPARRRGHRARPAHRPQHPVDPARGVAPRRGPRPRRRLVVRRALHRRAGRRRRGRGSRRSRPPAASARPSPAA